MKEQVTYRVGYVDENENQVKRYRADLEPHGFEVIGYQFFKGMSLQELMSQIYSSKIDLLMIDYKLKQGGIVTFNGEEVESEIYNNWPLFPHIIFTSLKSQAEHNVEDLKIIFEKDVFENSTSTESFVDMLRRSIQQYQNHIIRKKQVVSDLLEKFEAQGLNAKEKDLLLNTQNDLHSLNRAFKPEVPAQLVFGSSPEDLQKIREEAELFLKTLNENGEGKG